jgi:hypothetical protein
LLLARLLATALLLLAGFRLLTGLIALLLLTRVLVGILILTHCISFQRWSFALPARTSTQRPNANPVPIARWYARRNPPQIVEFPITSMEVTYHGTLSVALAAGDSTADPVLDLDLRRTALARIAHDPEKWESVFGKYHAQLSIIPKRLRQQTHNS